MAYERFNVTKHILCCFPTRGSSFQIHSLSEIGTRADDVQARTTGLQARITNLQASFTDLQDREKERRNQGRLSVPR
jgi:hypothetical protein